MQNAFDLQGHFTSLYRMTHLGFFIIIIIITVVFIPAWTIQQHTSIVTMTTCITLLRIETTSVSAPTARKTVVATM